MSEEILTLSDRDGAFIPDGIRFERILDHPVERVWEALTQPDQLGEWLGRVSIEGGKGGVIQLEMTGGMMGGTILQWKEHSLLEYQWFKDSVVSWELLREGPGRCRLIFTTRRVPASLLESAAVGWHFHLDALALVLGGGELPGGPAGGLTGKRTFEGTADPRSASSAGGLTGVGKGIGAGAGWYTYAVAHWDDISRPALSRYGQQLREWQRRGPTPAPIVMERTLDAPVARVWQALTDKEEIRRWSFTIPEFEPTVGFDFTFDGESETRRYVHLCRVTEVIPGRKLAYSWRYENIPGITYVSFELFPEGDKTRLRLSHEGLENLAHAGPDFVRTNYEGGWTSILDKGLASYLGEQVAAG